jgi:hypothetical protein
MIHSCKQGILVEVAYPATTIDTYRCWISDKREGSSTRHQILAYATGNSIDEAIVKAYALIRENRNL